MRFTVLFYSLVLLLLPLSSAADFKPAKTPVNTDTRPVFDYDVALKTSQAAIGRQLSNHAFINADGQQVRLNDFHGKPLIISMIYTSCYQICPMTTRHLSKMVDKARDAVGEDSFAVAVIGFDTDFDTPDAMQYFANKQGISNKNWNLLTVAKNDLGGLVEELGFLYYPSSNGYDHLIQATIIDADGEVYRQVYGQVFDTPLLVDPLLELVLGRPRTEQSFIDNLSNRIKLFCTTYDPVRDGYFFDYSLFVGIFVGASIIFFTILFMRKELRKSRK